MKTASISDLKDRLSAYIDGVRAGDPLLVTDRKRPVAILQPVGSESLPLRSSSLRLPGL